jgi:Arc/MetJ-type ribon-helix-helix transcriptional regulator
MSKKIEFQLGNFKKSFVAGNLSDIPEVQALVNRFKHPGENRGNVVMVRLSDEAVKSIDLLVDATLFSSRSEAAAFLVGAGIENQKDLLQRLNVHTEEIRKLKDQLRNIAVDALKTEPAK